MLEMTDSGMQRMLSQSPRYTVKTPQISQKKDPLPLPSLSPFLLPFFPPIFEDSLMSCVGLELAM